MTRKQRSLQVGPYHGMKGIASARTCTDFRYTAICSETKSIAQLSVTKTNETNTLWYFSPWENEQLACIRDYFSRILSLGLSHTFTCILPLYLQLT